MLRFPDILVDEEIPLAGVDFINRLKTNETIATASVSATGASVTISSTQASGTQVLFTITSALVGETIILVSVTGTQGTKRKAYIGIKTIA